MSEPTITPAECPHCQSLRFPNSGVFLCGYVDGHVRTDKCRKRQEERDERVNAAIEAARMERHFQGDY